MNIEHVYIRDDYVTVKPGEPFRLFPIGKLFREGTVRNLTRKLLAQFKLPHFKPPIKLGSHKDETPAGGFITGLELKNDGLYAIPEFTEKGKKALIDGDYRYQSPEIMWDGGLVDATTGETTVGPLIVGAALLHTPALGSKGAMYSVEYPKSRRQLLSGHTGLAVGIIDQSVRDYQSDNLIEKGDAELFFASPWYQDLMDGLDMHPQTMPIGVEIYAAQRIMNDEMTAQEAGHALDALIKYRAKRSNITYQDAVLALATSKPALFNAYYASTKKPPTQPRIPRQPGRALKERKLKLIAAEIEEWKARKGWTTPEVFAERPKLAERYLAVQRSR